MYWGKRPRLNATAALALLAMLYVLLVWGSSVALRGARIDLTADRLYTLSAGTRRIVAALREPVQLTLYFSDRASRDLPQLRAYRQRVGDMLEEIARRSDGRIRVQVVDPLPYSEDEDAAAAAGLIAVPSDNGEEKLFFGVTARNLVDGRSGAIPFLLPDREPLLEFGLARLVLEISQKTRPRVDVLGALPIAGSAGTAAHPAQDAWKSLQQLQPLFDVHVLSASALKRIDPSTRLLVLAGPRDLPDDALYAIDQYVLRGGKLLAFVDPDMEMDAGRAADLPRLFHAWGVVFDPAQVVLDRDRALAIQPNPDTTPVRHPAVLGFSGGDLNRNDPVTAALGTIDVSTTGRFELANGTGTRLVPLIQSSAGAMMVSAQRVRDAYDPATLYQGYAPAGEHYAIAARVVGRFVSAFPQRTEAGHLARADADCHVLLVADTDVLSDRLWVQLTPSFGQTLANAFADNGEFFFNAVDGLAGSPDLIEIRRRAIADRPFTTVDNLRRAADEKFKSKQNELLVELADTEARLTTLQGHGGSSGVSQKAAVDQFVQRKAQIRAELREVQRQLDADIETLGARLKFLDILLMPILLTLVALAYGGWRTRRGGRRTPGA
ncbi:MAG: Gldg family protein [Proteobacteria bacterium]|nr:Gldg family protein [Pseudomonadota bacterium]